MPIEIIIKNSENGQDNITSPDNPLQSGNQASEGSVAERKVSGQIDAGQALVVNFLKTQALSLAKTSVQTYTKYTGKGNLQSSIDNAINIASDLGSIAVAGASFGMAGLAVASLGVVAKYTMAQFNKDMEIKMANRQLTFIKQGLGDIVVSGGRYGG